MRLDARFRRLTSTALAVVVLVSSLTCMTAACRAVCAAEAGAGAATAAADLPPCHRAPGDAPAGSAGDCGSGTACCSTWLHDRDGFVLVAPVLVREPVATDFLALVPAGFAFRRPVPAFAPRSATDPPDPRALHPASPRASRAPPAA